MADTLSCTLGHIHINEGVMYLTLATQLEAYWEITVILVCFFLCVCVVHDLGDMPRDRGSVIWSLPCLKLSWVLLFSLKCLCLPPVLCSPPDRKFYKVWGYELIESLLPYHLATHYHHSLLAITINVYGFLPRKLQVESKTPGWK